MVEQKQAQAVRCAAWARGWAESLGCVPAHPACFLHEPPCSNKCTVLHHTTRSWKTLGHVLAQLKGRLAPSPPPMTCRDGCCQAAVASTRCAEAGRTMMTGIVKLSWPGGEARKLPKLVRSITHTLRHHHTTKALSRGLVAFGLRQLRQICVVTSQGLKLVSSPVRGASGASLSSFYWVPTYAVALGCGGGFDELSQ